MYTSRSILALGLEERLLHNFLQDRNQILIKSEIRRHPYTASGPSLSRDLFGCVYLRHGVYHERPIRDPVKLIVLTPFDRLRFMSGIHAVPDLHVQNSVILYPDTKVRSLIIVDDATKIRVSEDSHH